MNAASHFVDRHLADGRGERVAYRTARGSTTYAELAELVNRAGNGLRELGVEEEQRVLLLLDDGVELVAAFFGAIKIGAIPVPVNPTLRAAEIAWLLEDSRARAAVVAGARLADAGAALDAAPRLRAGAVVVVGNAGDGAGPRRTPWESWIAGASPELDAVAVSSDDAAFWLYSSGSTGQPKGVVHLQRDMPASVECYARGVLSLTERDRLFSASKLFHAYGLGNGGYFPLGVGAEAYLHAGRPTADSVLEVIAGYRPTVFFAVPTLYAALLHHEEALSRCDWSSVRLCVSAGEPLPPEVCRRWQARFGVELLDGIGTTELLHIFISNRPGEVRPGSSGRVVPGYEAMVVDEQGQPLPHGELGNLRVRGGSIMSGYWRRPDKTRAALFGEWIQTGDKYTQDADGFFHYRGRADDMLKVSGQWVSPVEVENALGAHPAVREAAVVGCLDDAGLIKPRAYVVLADAASGRGGAELAAELQAFVKGAIAPHKYPRWIDFVAELPKTTTGKILRFKLRAES